MRGVFVESAFTEYVLSEGVDLGSISVVITQAMLQSVSRPFYAAGQHYAQDL